MNYVTVGTKNFRGKMSCASEIGLYHLVVMRVKDYTRENTRHIHKYVYVIQGVKLP